MSSNTLCGWVRAAAIAVAICGIAACVYILPSFGADVAVVYPEFAHCYLPWLIFLWAAAAPCFAILWLVWRVSTAIKQEQVFTIRTARWIKLCAALLFCDAGFFFAGNALFALLNMSHPGILFLSLFVDVLGVSLAVAAATLSRYITKAAALQEESEGTI